MSIHLLNPYEIKGLHKRVQTAYGEGVSQGRVEIKVGESHVDGVLVRLPLNDVTRLHLRDANCVTPRANRSALFIFALSELP